LGKLTQLGRIDQRQRQTRIGQSQCSRLVVDASWLHHYVRIGCLLLGQPFQQLLEPGIRIRYGLRFDFAGRAVEQHAVKLRFGNVDAKIKHSILLVFLIVPCPLRTRLVHAGSMPSDTVQCLAMGWEEVKGFIYTTRSMPSGWAQADLHLS
jgi:hypothetical protein